MKIGQEKISRMYNRHPATNNHVDVNSTKTVKTETVKSAKNDKYLDFVIKIILWLAILLMPLFFVTNTPSALGLGKQVVLVGLVGIAFLLWVGRMAIKSQIQFRANFIYIPIFVLLITFGLSTVFSDYSTQSLWGFFGGEGRSYVVLIFLVTFFVLFVNNIKTKKEIMISLWVAWVSGLLVTLFGILQLWGKYILPIDGTHDMFFNTIGSVYLFGVYVSLFFLLTLSMFLYFRKMIVKILLGIVLFVVFVLLTIVNLKVVWIGLIIALAFIFGAFIIGNSKDSSFGNILLMIFLVLSLLMILRGQPIINKQLPAEVLLTHKASAIIAWKSIKHNFLFGNGPANYINVYRLYRPVHSGNFWATNFNTASSYLLTLASTVGVLGVASFLFLVVSGLMYIFKGIFSIKDKKMATLAMGIGSAWILLTMILLFYITNITILFAWWLVLALLVSLLSFGTRTQLREFSTGGTSGKPSLLFSFVFVLVIIGVIVALYVQGQKYMAAVHFSRALVADAKGEDIEKIVDEINKAVMLDMNRDLYYRNRSLAFFAQANKKIAEKGSSDKKGLSAEDSAYVSKAIQQSLMDAIRSDELNPKDVDNKMAIVNVYESLLPNMEGAGDKALEYAKKAIELDPENPIVYQRLANIYVAMADIETLKVKDAKELPDKAKEYLVSAKENFNKALELNPNLLSAQLGLVGVYSREGNKDKVIEAMVNSRKVAPKNPNLAFQLGLLYFRDDKLDEAGSQFVQAIQLDKNYANAHFYLGLVLDKKDRKDLAIKEFEKVLELNKGNKMVQQIIDNLKAGKDALADLQKPKAPKQTSPVNTEQSSANNTEGSTTNGSQPTINPAVEPQVVPEEATQNIDIQDQGQSQNQDQNNDSGSN